ncbi:MAG: DEAD/DEAH box helicase family protein [Bacteroidales bacterium]|nr:DEAD/DEAH box helicase family protein [Bacteroidales bacterium]
MLQEAIDIQQNAIAELLRKIGTKREITFRAPTGSGKTRMMADFMNRVLQTDNNVVFLVSTLSKGNLAEQNYTEFKGCADNMIFPKLKPYLISSEAFGEERLFIPTDYNVYVLPRDLYKDKSKLKDEGALVNFLETIIQIKDGRRNYIYLIRDECHQATNNLNDIATSFFEKIINFSATPNLHRGQIPDVEITDEAAEKVKLIKTVEWDEEKDLPEKERGKHPETAIRKFKEIRKKYINMLGVNPCLIIQISNKDKADEEWTKIKDILNQTEHQDLKWMLILDDKKKCDTNDDIKKLPVEKWKDYAKGKTSYKGKSSTIDIIIFKMTISEGWDIPRACMLYQMRDTKSKQLDEQVIGRVRRNPRLGDFEKLSAEAQILAMTAWVWGVLPEKGKKSHSVRLFGSSTDIPSAIKLKITRLKFLTERKDFDIAKLIDEKTKNEVVHRSIFSLYAKLQKSDNDIRDLCYDYADNVQKWWNFCENIDSVRKEYDNYICDYAKSMEVVKDYKGDDKEVSFPLTSMYIDNSNYQNISNWVWRRKDGIDKFSFDSEAEREWASILKDISYDDMATIEVGDPNPHYGTPRLDGTVEPRLLNAENKYLWGKNFPTNSEIKFEYYQNGVHSSYPDFVMKDKFGRIHIFEVKSVNVSNSAHFDTEEYRSKINALRDCYKYCSKITDQYYYLPVLRDDEWRILTFINGEESIKTKEIFIKNLKSSKML